MCIIAGHGQEPVRRVAAKFQPHIGALVGRPEVPPPVQRLAGTPIKALRPLQSVSLLCGGGHSTEFPLLLGSASIVSNSVIDLQERTYCIIVHIHFVGAPVVVALSLEKGRTFQRMQVKFFED